MRGGGSSPILPSTFTPLGSPAACSGDEDNSLLGANPVRDLSLNGADTEFNAPREPSG